jgi:NDP-4-keto-2,6-dideoxyhexose 3-C-methyltransferase
MENVTEIKTCRACQEPFPPKNVFSLGTMAVVSFPERADAEQLNAPLELVECPRCTLVQLRHTVNPDLMFRDYWYRSGVSATMRAALKDVVESAQKFVTLEPGDAVCDVGSNDGTLLSFYHNKVHCVGFEPSNARADDRSNALTVFEGYFERKNFCPELHRRFKIITAISMFYDLSDPGQFLEDVKWALAPGGIFIVQMNYLASMLDNLAVDNIEHEHLCYYSAKAFNLLCEVHGMTVVNIETNDVNGGSIRLYVQAGEIAKSESFHCEEKEYLSVTPLAWKNFISRLDTIKSSIREWLFGPYWFGRRLGICGASTRGLALLHFLNIVKDVPGNPTFACASERDPAKHGRFYGSTGIPIVSEEEARERCHMMLVLPYHFAAEIIEREREWIAQGGELLIPLPRPRIISNQGERFL